MVTKSQVKALFANYKNINYKLIASTIAKLPDELTREMIEDLARDCDSKVFHHYEWSYVAGNMIALWLREYVSPTFSSAMEKCKQLLNPKFYEFVVQNAKTLDAMIVPERDMDFARSGMNTLLNSYLLRIKKDNTPITIETPQFMYLRIAVFLWFPNLERIKEVYEDLSTGKYSQASPTMFNSGLVHCQCSSCYLMEVEDNLEDIAQSWRKAALISRHSGGIGMDYSALRHSMIGNHGSSKGVIPWLQIQEKIMNTVDQGGKRNGSQTAYLCDWHADVQEFVEARKPTTPENLRAIDLFYGLWIHDLFMERVRDDKMWSLFCPHIVKQKGYDLVNLYGTEFEVAYLKCEEQKLFSKQISARSLFIKILTTQQETGMPFMLYADACNRKSNQKNLGTIRLSNLCTEIVEYVDSKEIANCNLGSVCLSSFAEGKSFDFDELGRCTRALVRNLNQLVDRNFYQEDIPEIKRSNNRHRPLGIGVQGLANAFQKLHIPWESEEARRLNFQIFETMYFAAVDESCSLAKVFGPYETFEGSPMSKGFFQFDLWDQELLLKKGPQAIQETPYKKMSRIDERLWTSLKQDVVRHGVRNSLLLALMPTASTAIIRGNTESFEPGVNLIARNVLAGQYITLNRCLVDRMVTNGQWTTENVRELISTKGSVQTLAIDDLTKQVFKTQFEISQKTCLQMAIDRGRFICQSQSMNCFMKDVSNEKLYSYHMFGWQNGIKTGMYYLRQPQLHTAINIAVNDLQIQKVECSNEEGCISCST